MKKLSLLFFVFAICSNLLAQEQETLFRKARVVGAFGGPIVEIGSYDGETGTAIGGGGGLIIDNFFLGGYGLGGTNITEQLFDSNGDNFSLDIGHGGLWLGFTYKQYKLLHLFSSVKLGWGGVGIEFDDGGPDYDDGIFVVTPELGLELNIFRFFKISATAGYRYVDGIRADGTLDDDHFNGMVGTLTFRFGGFGNWRDW
ncbi:MAG: hypothetical protein AAGG75_08825 [Bacteroidota bacterium]